MAIDNKEIAESIFIRLRPIYVNETSDVLHEIAKGLSARFTKKTKTSSHRTEKWDASTCVLITYADSLSQEDVPPLKTLSTFLDEYLIGMIDTVHILPFFPSSSDDGFSVMHYKNPDKHFGTWDNIHEISGRYRVMADLVINHGSRSGEWFKDFLDDKDPGADFFFTVDNTFDTSQVIRPRDHNLIQSVNTKSQTKQVWCTFSEDQVDYNFENPRVLAYFLHTIYDFIDRGISVLRLDAIGFLWKKSGSSCLNLKQTHAIVKLIRYVCEQYAPNVIIVTETNLPNQENLSYFGNGNEAHWIYNFPLPPLILHSLLASDSTALRRWAMSMPPALEGTSYLNFLASHDGFGLRPIEGLMSEQEQSDLVNRLEKNGSLFTWRLADNGSKKIYEANITLFSALEKCDQDPEGNYQLERFFAAHLMMFSLEGIPALYINSVLGAKNDNKGAKVSGINRRINRKKFLKEEVVNNLDVAHSIEKTVLEKISQFVAIRSKQRAFHPNATQFTLQLGPHFFGVWRQSRDRSQSIFAITNITSKRKTLPLDELNLIDIETWRDLLIDEMISINQTGLPFSPYQTAWITNN